MLRKTSFYKNENKVVSNIMVIRNMQYSLNINKNKEVHCQLSKEI
jgi:hypothetical protein